MNYFNNNSFIKIMERISFPIIYEGSEEIIQTYNLFRRTLLNPDKEDIKEREEYMEFIIDKFGYLRSRWKKEEIIDQGRSFDYKLMIKILNEEISKFNRVLNTYTMQLNNMIQDNDIKFISY